MNNPETPPQADPAAREKLFEPGRYLACPDVILRRRDLPASAKCVWMALAGHLGPQAVQVWPSISRLQAMTGLGRDTVIAAIAALERAGLVTADRISPEQGRKYNLYRILQPQAGLFDNQSEKSTSRKSRPY